MWRLGRMAIKHKLISIIMATSISALLLVGVIVVIWGQITVRRSLVENLSAQAEMIADNCTAAVAFDNAEDAESILKTLRAQPSVVFGKIHTLTEENFAKYSRDDIDKDILIEHQEDDGYVFEGGVLNVSKSIILDGEKTGLVCIQSDLIPLRTSFRRTVSIFAVAMLFASLAAFLLSSRLQRIISGPILNLTEVATLVSDKKDYSTRAQVESNDEVGLLTGAFNGMLGQIQEHQAAMIGANEQLEERVRERTAELEQTHRKLMETSRQAGMAEVATGVLHNVGNVLNSVNVATQSIKKRLVNLKVDNLAKAMVMLEEHADNLDTFLTADERGIKLRVYLNQLSEGLVEEQKELIELTGTLDERVQSIAEIVNVQQSYAKSGGVTEIVSVRDVVEDAIAVNLAGLGRHGADLEREYEDLPPILLDRQKLLQIIINIISNAKYSLQTASKQDKLITIRIKKKGQEHFQIEISDNGVGIVAEDITNIFRHGFTTRTEGHGFGLHSAALAAKEMAGELCAHSDGPGKGATFVLELPLRTNPERVAIQ